MSAPQRSAGRPNGEARALPFMPCVSQRARRASTAGRP